MSSNKIQNPQQQMATFRTISIQVPENAAAGDTLCFVVEGQELEICLPEGCQPLDVIEIQAEVGEETASRTPSGPEAKPTKLPATGLENIVLFNGKSLELVMNAPADGKNVLGSGSDVDGTHRMVWPCTRLVLTKEEVWPWILSETVHPTSPPSPFPYQQILELGSGLGLLGMALALNLVDKSFPCDHKKEITFTLTDCASAIPSLKANLDQNCSLLRSPKIRIGCQALDWNEISASKGDDSTRTDSLYDLIVGSDLLYNVNQIPALVETVGNLLCDRGTMLLLVRWRKPELERSFLSLTAQKHQMHWSLVSASLLPCSLDWSEFGNPDCDASNTYFRRTMQISVGGSAPKCLAEISEEDTSRMTEAEYEAWERAHTQVYRGHRQCSDDHSNNDTTKKSDSVKRQRMS